MRRNYKDAMQNLYDLMYDLGMTATARNENINPHDLADRLYRFKCNFPREANSAGIGVIACMMPKE